MRKKGAAGLLALTAITLGACERKDPATGLVSHRLVSTESDDRDYESVALYKAAQVSIVLGEGNYLEGFDVIRINCDAESCTVTKAWRVPPSNQYKWAVQTQEISRETFDAVVALLEGNNWRDLKARYASNIADGTTILLKISADGTTKETSADNHFPRELLRIVKGIRDIAPSPESIKPTFVEDSEAYDKMKELLSPPTTAPAPAATEQSSTQTPDTVRQVVSFVEEPAPAAVIVLSHRFGIGNRRVVLMTDKDLILAIYNAPHSVQYANVKPLRPQTPLKWYQQLEGNVQPPFIPEGPEMAAELFTQLKSTSAKYFQTRHAAPALIEFLQAVYSSAEVTPTITLPRWVRENERIAALMYLEFADFSDDD